MRKLYHLSTCSTCQRIIKNLDISGSGLILQDIKTEKITTEQLEEMSRLAGGYEPLFSRRSMKYKSMGLKDKVLSEDDYRNLILEEYTFLKRPVKVPTPFYYPSLPFLATIRVRPGAWALRLLILLPRSLHRSYTRTSSRTRSQGRCCPRDRSRWGARCSPRRRSSLGR